MVSWKVCECSEGEFVRIKRPWWAKLCCPRRQMFVCTQNGRRMLVHPQEIKEAEWLQRARHREFLERVEQERRPRWPDDGASLR